MISLLAPLLILLIAVTILYGFAPLRALGQNWLLLFTAFLPALAIMILLNNVAEGIGWTGFVFARLQDRHGPRRPADDTVLLAVPRAEHLCRNTIMGDHGTWCWASCCCRIWAAASSPAGSTTAQRVDRRIVPHSMHNAIVNSTGLVAVVGLPQVEVLVIMVGIVVLAGAIVVLATRGRLGLKRPESDTDLTRDG
jgi:hypothetical protein